jgi:predicted nuclease of predicted toxin-antitoxin system
MKLLLDENLSHKLVWLLADLFPDSIHVRGVDLKAADDPVVWEYAKNNDLMIVSKDSDMHQRSFVFGHPPKVVWVRRLLLDIGRGKIIARTLRRYQSILRG